MSLKPVLITLCLFCFSIKLLSQVDSAFNIFYHDLSEPSELCEPLLNEAEEKEIEDYLQKKYKDNFVKIYVIVSREENLKEYAKYMAEKWKLKGIIIAISVPIENPNNNGVYISVAGNYKIHSRYFKYLVPKGFMEIDKYKLNRIIYSTVEIVNGKKDERINLILFSVIFTMGTILIILIYRKNYG